MSAAYRSHGRGTLILKGTFAGIWLELASGTRDPKLLGRLKEMLRTLVDAGRLEFIRGIADRSVKPLELWEYYRTGDWSKMLTTAHVRPLAPILTAWVEGQANAYSKKGARTQMARILEYCPPSPTLADLPEAIRAYRVVCEAKDQAQMFNHVRSAAQALIRGAPGLGLHSPLWTAIAQIERLSVTPLHAPNPQRPADAWLLRQLMGERDGAIWWAMCVSGMGPDEYFANKWAIQDGRLLVHGTKRAARERVVPLIWDIESTTRDRAAWEAAFRRRQLGVVPYDARRSFAIWLAECGIPEHRQQVYMGHGPRTMTQLYQRVTDQYLDEDEARLRALLGGTIGGTPTPDAREDGVLPAHLRPGLKEPAKGVEGPNIGIRGSEGDPKGQLDGGISGGTL